MFLSAMILKGILAALAPLPAVPAPATVQRYLAPELAHCRQLFSEPRRRDYSPRVRMNLPVVPESAFARKCQIAIQLFRFPTALDEPPYRLYPLAHNNSPRKFSERYSNTKPPLRAVLLYLGRLFYTIFTSIVTPDGRLRFVRASITFGDGFMMSMSRLWMRISNCSRASL